MRKPKFSDETEWFVKKQVKQILEDTGWKFWMPNAGMYGRSGVSDFLAMKRPKQFMAIETKYDDVVTAPQFKFLTDVHEAGHYAFLVDESNVEELQKLLMSDLRDHTVEALFKSFLKWKDQNKLTDIRIAKT